jgi:hypothetical protein
MSKAVAKVTIEQQKKNAKTNKYLGSGDILREQLDLYKIEATKLGDELLVMTQSYISVATVKHEGKLKDNSKEGAIRTWKNTIESRQRTTEKSVEKFESAIQNEEEALREAIKDLERKSKIKIDKIRSNMRDAVDEGNRIINLHQGYITACYEEAAVEVPVQVKYPPTYYKKLEQKKDLDRSISNIAKNIAIIDALGDEADKPVITETETVPEKKQVGLTPWAVIGVDPLKDPEEAKRARDREQAIREDAQRKKLADQQAEEKQQQEYSKKNEVIAKLRKAEEEVVVAEEEDISDEDISDEKDNQIRIDILKKDISDLNYFIQDMIEELAADPSNSVLEAELNINKEKRMDMKKELKERIRKVF